VKPIASATVPQFDKSSITKLTKQPFENAREAVVSKPPKQSTVQSGEKFLTLKQAYELAQSRGCDAPTRKAFSRRAERNAAKVESELGLRRLNNSSSVPTASSFEDIW